MTSAILILIGLALLAFPAVVVALALIRGGTRHPTPRVPGPVTVNTPPGGYWIDTPRETEARR